MVRSTMKEGHWEAGIFLVKVAASLVNLESDKTGNQEFDDDSEKKVKRDRHFDFRVPRLNQFE